MLKLSRKKMINISECEWTEEHRILSIAVGEDDSKVSGDFILIEGHDNFVMFQWKSVVSVKVDSYTPHRVFSKEGQEEYMPDSIKDIRLYVRYE